MPRVWVQLGQAPKWWPEGIERAIWDFVDAKDKDIKKETSQIRNNNSILLKRLTIQVTKETNLFELFMIILISKEIIRVLSVIE